MFTSYDTETQQVSHVYSKDELVKSIDDTISYYELSLKRLHDENKKMRENAKAEVSKEFEHEINYLREKLRLSYGSFASQKELDAYNDFEQRHMHDRETSRYNGGRAPYLIPTGTGLGVIVHVKCPICGEEENITDDSVW